MNWLRALLAWLGLAAPVVDSGVCECHCLAATHDHHSPRRKDCGACGRTRCPRYRAVQVTEDDIFAICADDKLIDAIHRGDREAALKLGSPAFVDALFAWVAEVTP